jgi:hypothetical protein
MRKKTKQLLYDLKEKRVYCKLKNGSTGLHSVENLLWKKLWTCRKTDYILMLYVKHLHCCFVCV